METRYGYPFVSLVALLDESELLSAELPIIFVAFRTEYATNMLSA